VCSDVFIKAYDDVRALDKSVQKLRGLLNEALSKLHGVINTPCPDKNAPAPLNKMLQNTQHITPSNDTYTT